MKASNLFYLTIIFGLIGASISYPVYAQKTDLQWQNFEQALELAEEKGKLIMVDVWAPWCGWCKKMKKEVYPELSAELNSDFVLTRLNRDNNEDKKTYQQYRMTPLRLAQKFGVQNVPATVFLSSEGEYLFHISGFVGAEELKEVLGYVSRKDGQALR